MVAIIVANAIVASRLTNGRASDVKYKFNPGKSIERSARFHLSRSCHSLPGFSLLFSLVCASFRSRRSFARKYARRKTRSKSLSFARRLQKIISNYLVIIDSKKNVIVVGSLLFTIPFRRALQTFFPFAKHRGTLDAKGVSIFAAKRKNLEVNNIVASNNVAAMLKPRFSSPPPPLQSVCHLRCLFSLARLVDKRTFSRVYRGEPRIPPNQLRSYISGGVAAQRK